MDIVEEIRQDREKGAKRLESEYKAGLMTLARRFCVDQSDAEELVNATFATVIENIDDYLEQSAFFAWMCQILTSLHSRNVRRKSGKEIVYPGVVPDAIDEKAQEEIYENLDHSLVREALGKLEPDEKELLVLRYFLDIPVAKMAKVLSIPAGTVKSRLHYARKALAAKLGIQAEKVGETVKKPGVKAVLLALALCALTAAAVTGIARWGELSEPAVATLGSDGVVPRATAIGETGETGRIRRYSLFAPSAPVPPDSPVPPVPNVPSTSLSKEQPMNTTLRSLAASAAFAAATAATPMTGSGADWYVSPDGTGGGTSPSDRGDLMGVLYNGQVASGDTIHLAEGTYNLDVNKIPAGSGYGAYLRVPDGIANLTVVGETGNPDGVRLVGNSADKKRILYFPAGGNVVRDLTIYGGCSDYQGAGICMADSLIGNPESAFTASNCVVENCSAGYQGGGGFGGLWRDCVIRNNEARNKVSFPEGSGGGVFHAVLHGCVITNNYAGFCGGGIAGGRQNGASSNYPLCLTRAYNCLIGGNRSVYGGGAAVAPENSAYENLTPRDYCQLFGCTIVENAVAYDSTGDGGGLGGGTYQCVVSNCVVRGNSATRGNDSAFNAYGHDYGVGKGGGVMDCEVIDSTLENNTCTGGGAGASNSDLAGCVLQDNSATGGSPSYANYGGGAYSCTLVDCVLAGNSAGYGGGAFRGNLENCVISNNTTTAYDGGAAYNANTRNCIVVGNQAHRWYALCQGTHYGDLVFANSNGNLDHYGNDWGNAAIAIGADSEGQTVAVNCTVWWNTHGSADVSLTALTNCIVQSVGDIPSAVNSFWVYENGTVANQSGCISGIDKDPKFEGLGVSETVTAATPPQSFALKTGSPCCDKGLTLAGQQSEMDILGNKRVKYGIVDMGAIECLGELPFTIILR